MSRWSIAAFVPLIAASAVSGQGAAADSTPRPAAISPERLETVRRYVVRSRAWHGLPGVAVSVASADSVLLAFGSGGPALDGTPLDGHSPFLIGSVTKTFTAMLISRLASDGRLDLDEPVESYLPGFSMRAPFTPRSISIRQLASHTSGLSQWSGHDRRAQASGEVGHLAPARAPGLRGEYSSLNFILLGSIVEQVSREPYARVLRALLFEPIGMDDAFVDGSDPRPEGLAQGHQSYFGFNVSRAEPDPPRFLVPAGFVAASAHDLGRFGGALIGGGVFGGARVLDSTAVAAVLGPTDTTGRSLAWGRQRVNGKLLIEHAGNSRTTSARVRLVPERGYAIAVLANTNSGPFFPATRDVMDGIQAILDGESTPPIRPRERMFKGVLLVGTALSVVQFGRRVHAWNAAERPHHIAMSARVVGPLALEVAGGAILLAGIPRYFGVPLSTMTEYFPDMGIALVTTAGAGIAGGVLHAMTRSRR